MSIFGPKIKKPKNFDKTEFFKKYINTDNSVFDTMVNGFRLSTLLLQSESGFNANKVKALKKLVATGKAVDSNNNEVLLGADFMQNIVEPLAWARLNLNTPLSNQIFKFITYLRDTWELQAELYDDLSDEEAKIAAVRRYVNVSSNIKDNVKKLVLNSKYSSLDDVSKVFKKEQLSKAEFDAIWARLKPRLLELMSDNVAKEYKITAGNGVTYLSLRGHNFAYRGSDNELAFGAEKLLLDKLIHYMRVFVSDFKDAIIDDVPYAYDGRNYRAAYVLYDYNGCEYINKAFIDKIDDIIKYKLPAAMEKDEVKKLQLQKDGLDKQFDAEIQAIKDFVAARKVKIQFIKASKQEIDAKLKTIEEENERKETERKQSELQKKQDEFEALAAQLGVNPADLLALQQQKGSR